jgi:hypothetical protein
MSDNEFFTNKNDLHLGVDDTINEELISQFINLQKTLIKNGVDLRIIKGIPLRKKTKTEYNAYYKNYMKDKYSSDPVYREKVKERSKKAYLLKKANTSNDLKNA